MLRVLVLLSVLLVPLAACTHDADDAQQTLAGEGYTDIRLTGHNFFACGEDDELATGFVATKNGRRVEGTICGNWFGKDQTIRIGRSTPLQAAPTDPFRAKADSVLAVRERRAYEALVDSLKRGLVR